MDDFTFEIYGNFGPQLMLIGGTRQKRFAIRALPGMVSITEIASADNGILVTDTEVTMLPIELVSERISEALDCLLDGKPMDIKPVADFNAVVDLVFGVAWSTQALAPIAETEGEPCYDTNLVDSEDELIAYAAGYADARGNR